MSRAPRARTTLLVLLASLLCAAVVLQTGCSGITRSAVSEAQSSSESSGDERDAPAGDTESYGRPGSNVEVVNGRLFWGFDETLWSAELASSGKVKGMEPLIEFDEDVDMLAANGEDLYVCCYDGIWLVDLNEADDEAEKLVDVSFSDDFWVTANALLYQDNDELWRSGLAGDDAELIGESVEHFAVLGDTIYYVDDDGTLRAMGIDGSNERKVAKAPSEDAVLLAHDGTLYLADEDEELCQLDGEEVVEVGLSHKVGDPDRVIFSDDAIFYYATNENRYRHTGDDEDEKLPGGIYFWGYQHGRACDGFYLSTISGDEIDVFDLDTYDYTEYEVDGDETARTTGDKDKGSTDGSGGDKGTTTGGTSGTTPSKSYDIAEGLEMHLTGGSAVLTTSHFSLVLDGQEVTDGLWIVEQTSDTSISFYYSKARDSGYDGFVFSLTAYDWGDNSYADLPNYRIGGLSADKKYVIDLPTDVRYDVGSATQKNEYNRMLAFAESIDSNRNPSGNPLTILDF